MKIQLANSKHNYPDLYFSEAVPSSYCARPVKVEKDKRWLFEKYTKQFIS